MTRGQLDEFVVLLGDNMYGRQNPEDFVTKFEQPYRPLIESGVRFFATLGNHELGQEPAPFHDLFGRGGDNVMKTLKAIKREVRG